MEITAQRPSIIYRPLGIILAALAVITFWLLFSGNPTMLVLIAIAALFLFGLRRPVWAMASLIVCQLTITSYMVATPFDTPISLRLILIVLIVLVVWSAFGREQIDFGPKTRRLVIPIIILIIVSTASNLVNSSFDFAFRDFRNMLVGLLIVLFIPVVTRNLRELKILCGVSFVVIIATAGIGLMQHFQILGMSQATLIPDFLTFTTEGEPRIPGMSMTELELAYILSAGLLVILSVYLAKGVNLRNRRLLLLSMILILPVLYFTYTRSALLAVGIGIIALLILLLRTRIRGEIILATALVAILVIETTGAFGGLYLGGRAETAQEESSTSRQILWQAGIRIAMDNPVLGIGGDQYVATSSSYTDYVDPELLAWESEQYWDYSTLGSEQIHNDYLYMWVSYGIGGLVAYIWLLFAIFRNFIESYKISKRPFIKSLAVGLAAALIACCINAFYHNFMNTIPLIWALGGFSLSLTKLATNEGKATKIHQSI